MALTHPILVPAIRLDHPDAAAEAETALRRAAEPWVAGFCLFGGEFEQVGGLIAELRARARGPIFVASDMERGAGQQVRGLPELPEAALWGLAATPAEVAWCGERTARDARAVGVDVLFAPVLDVSSAPGNPIVGHRAFGWEPHRVATLGQAFVQGALAGGAAPVAKHYPGHGATLADSHDDVPVVREGARRLEDRDLLPFRRVLASGECPAVMTAHVEYPALDSSGTIATFSPRILRNLRAMAPDPDDVAVFTDALCMRGAAGTIGEIEAARRALRAGCDLLLYPEDVEAVASALGEDAAQDPRPFDVAVGRARSLLARIEVIGAAAREADGAAGRDPAADVVRRAVAMSWWGGPERDWILVIDDDGVEGRGAHLAECGRRAGVPVGVVSLTHGERPPLECPVEGGWTVVFLASVRSSKGPAGLSPVAWDVIAGLREDAEETGRRLRFVFCGAEGDGEGIHLPGCHPLLERALAEQLLPPEA